MFSRKNKTPKLRGSQRLDLYEIIVLLNFELNLLTNEIPDDKKDKFLGYLDTHPEYAGELLKKGVNCRTITLASPQLSLEYHLLKDALKPEIDRNKDLLSDEAEKLLYPMEIKEEGKGPLDFEVMREVIDPITKYAFTRRLECYMKENEDILPNTLHLYTILKYAGVLNPVMERKISRIIKDPK